MIGRSGSDPRGFATSDAEIDADAATEPERPPRPMTVVLAATIMAVGGIVSTLQTVEATMALQARGEEPGTLALLSLAIGIGTAVLGALVYFRRGWLVAVNVAAIAGFLLFTSGSAQGFMFGGLDVLVVLLLMRDRPWFVWPGKPDEDGEDGEDAGESAGA
ncbi:MAG: hypothetical protein WCK58_17935 [Chloroflexota bacterium]